MLIPEETPQKGEVETLAICYFSRACLSFEMFIGTVSYRSVIQL